MSATPANVPSAIGLPAGAPSDIRSVAGFLTQIGVALSQWIAQAANALNHDTSVLSYLGTYQSAVTPFSSVVSLTTAIAANIASMRLAPGDWDVSATIYFNQSSAGIITQADAAISLASATLPSTSLGVAGFTQIGPAPSIGANIMFPTGALRVNVTSTTTVYLVGRAQFSTGTVGAFGTLQARRMG